MTGNTPISDEELRAFALGKRVTWQEAQSIGNELMALRAAGRPAGQPAELGDGGQESGHVRYWCAEHGVFRCAKHGPAAPVGGQAEPSDAVIERAAKVLYWTKMRPLRWESANEAERSYCLTTARNMLLAAAAVSGEQATPPSGNQR